MTQPMHPEPDPEAALARLHASWDGLVAAIEGIPADRQDEPGVVGEWSLGTLMGHVAFWDRYSRERGRDALAGLPPRDAPWEALNAQDLADRAGNTPEMNRADMDAAHAEMLAFVAAAPQDPATLVSMLARMATDTDEHYDEHAAEVRAWRARHGI